MSTQVQIDEELFLDLIVYFSGEPDEVLAEKINIALADKLDKIIARRLFTDYKTALSPKEREEARKKYLDHALISKSFRSDKETFT